MAATKRMANLGSLPFIPETRRLYDPTQGCYNHQSQLPLDYLAAIASEDAVSEAAGAGLSSVELRPSPEHHESGRITPELLVSDDRYTAAEKTAATALLMASLVRSQFGKEQTEAKEVTAQNQKQRRWLRLNQNQLYRRKLHEIGFFPVMYGRKRYGCSICNETFDKEMFVWRHGVKHLHTKPFSCDECGGTFNRSDSLQRHVRNFHRKD